jgi:predicted DNA-binding WGR domain protein
VFRNEETGIQNSVSKFDKTVHKQQLFKVSGMRNWNRINIPGLTQICEFTSVVQAIERANRL